MSVESVFGLILNAVVTCLAAVITTTIVITFLITKNNLKRVPRERQAQTQAYNIIADIDEILNDATNEPIVNNPVVNNPVVNNRVENEPVINDPIGNEPIVNGGPPDGNIVEYGYQRPEGWRYGHKIIFNDQKFVQALHKKVNLNDIFHIAGIRHKGELREKHRAMLRASNVPYDGFTFSKLVWISTARARVIVRELNLRYDLEAFFNEVKM